MIHESIGVSIFEGCFSSARIPAAPCVFGQGYKQSHCQQKKDKKETKKEESADMLTDSKQPVSKSEQLNSLVHRRAGLRQLWPHSNPKKMLNQTLWLKVTYTYSSFASNKAACFILLQAGISLLYAIIDEGLHLGCNYTQTWYTHLHKLTACVTKACCCVQWEADVQ